MKHLVKRLKKESDVDFHIYRFRHTFAVNALQNGVSLEGVRKLLGHSSIESTLKYLRQIPNSQHKEKLDNMNLDSFI